MLNFKSFSMLKLLRNAIALVILMFSVWTTSYAQEISSNDAIRMISKNASFLKLSSDDIKNSVVSTAYLDKNSGLQLVYLQQTYQDIPVLNSIQILAFKSGTAVNVSGAPLDKMEFRTKSVNGTPIVSAKQAVAFTAKALNIPSSDFAAAALSVAKSSDNDRKIEFLANSLSPEPIVAQLLWLIDQNGNGHLSWEISISPSTTSTGMESWRVYVDAKSPRELKRTNMILTCNFGPFETSDEHQLHIKKYPLSNSLIFTAPEVAVGNATYQPVQSSVLGKNNADPIINANYRVIKLGNESPVNGGFSEVSNPWLAASATPEAYTLGWHNDGKTEYKISRGNNVYAHQDPSKIFFLHKIGPVATSTTDLPNLNFLFNFNSETSPTTTANRNTAITNLFYWNNIMHDLSYVYGFDEQSGNFQNNNMGRGGKQGDYVHADVQDEGGKNNANFNVTADGTNGRMQMYLFNGVDNKSTLVNSPSAIAGYKEALEGQMSTNNKLADKGPITADVVLYQDNGGANDHLGCGAAVNAAQLKGKIALIFRGTCDFPTKVKNAQIAGAAAVIVSNNTPDNPDAVLSMGGDDNTIVIPSVMISYADGTAMKEQIEKGNSVNVTLSSKNVPDLDGDLDNGIVSHEFMHGISTRLTGGAANATCLSNNEQGGEGWGDFFALMLTTNWSQATVNDGPNPRGVGTYVLGQNPKTGSGIRRFPYSTNMNVNPWTYAGVKESGGEVHDIGEIWAAALWDMTWNMIQMDGIHPDLYMNTAKGGNIAALNVVMLGLKLQVCEPGFLDSRDAILLADKVLYNGRYECAIWNAFARRGMGVNAKQGSSNNTNDQTEDFTVPSGADIVKSVDKANVPENGELTYTFRVTAKCAGISDYKIVDTLPENLTYVSGGNYNAGNRTVSFEVGSLSASASKTYSFKAKVNSGTYFASSELFSEAIPDNKVPGSLVSASNVTAKWASSEVHHSAPYSLRAGVPSTASVQTLTSNDAFTVANHTQLTFWHQYDIETGHDGGVVELSTDGGSTWFDAGPYMSKNGYNLEIVSATNLKGKQAFSGASDGFLQTVVNLSAFEGKKVKFRFRFVTDATFASKGWWIDDIAIMKEAAVYNIGRLYDGNVLKAQSDTVTIISKALPLVWGSFTAEKSGGSSLLKWITLQESNTDKFVVERSTNGAQFMEIGSVNASGNSASSTSYSYTDNSPTSGVNIYRIRQVDLDGKFSYSENRSVNFDNIAGIISIAPNPTKGGTVVLHISGNKQELHVSLLNTAGQVLGQYNINKEKNDLLLPTLSSGVYYLKITGTNMTSMQRLVIEK